MTNQDDPVSTDTASATTNASLPTWGRVLVGLFFATVVLVLAGIGLVSYVIAQSGDPERVESITKSMVKIDQLPAGFKYERALEFFTTTGRLAIISYKDGSTFTFMKIPNTNKSDAKTMAMRLANSKLEHAPKLTTVSEGTEKVAGKDFAYVVGNVEAAPAKTVEQLRGVVLVDNDKNAITLTATTPSGKINMNATRELLASIKDF